MSSSTILVPALVARDSERAEYAPCALTGHEFRDGGFWQREIICRCSSCSTSSGASFVVRHARVCRGTREIVVMLQIAVRSRGEGCATRAAGFCSLYPCLCPRSSVALAWPAGRTPPSLFHLEATPICTSSSSSSSLHQLRYQHGSHTRQPEAVPPGPLREARPRPLEVGDGVQGIPRLDRQLHERAGEGNQACFALFTANTELTAYRCRCRCCCRLCLARPRSSACKHGGTARWRIQGFTRRGLHPVSIAVPSWSIERVWLTVPALLAAVTT